MSDWPKPWSEITDDGSDEPTGFLDAGASYLELTPSMRAYDSTVYLRDDAGDEANDDTGRWYPMDAYIRAVVWDE